MFKEQIQVLYSALVADTPILLWGGPGTGKTASVEYLAKALGWHLEVVVGATRDRTDFGGLPRGTPEGTVLDPFPFVARLMQAGRESIFFIDELTSTPEDVRPVLLRVINERKAGDHSLPCRIISAANPEDHAVGGLLLEAPIANRLLHLKWEMSPAEWALGITEGWSKLYPALPKIPDEQTLNAHVDETINLVALYLKRNPHAVRLLPPEGEEASKAWPSYRTWKLAAKVMGAAKAMGLSREVQCSGAVAAVGQEGYSFFNYLSELDLPDPEEVLRHPDLLPDREDRAYATLQAVVSVLSREWTQEHWINLQKVFITAARRGKSDLAAPAAGRFLRLAKDKREARQPTWPFHDSFAKEFAPMLSLLGKFL